MKNFKTYMTISGLVIMMALLLVPGGKTNGKDDGLKRLIAVTMLKAQTASDEAFEGAEKQRKLVKQQELLRSPTRESSKRIARPGSSGIGGAVSEKATDDNDDQRGPGRLTSCDVAREKAVLQQLEAHARRSAEALESVKRLAAELERRPSR